MASKVQSLVQPSDASTNLLSYQQRRFYILSLIKRLLPYIPMWEDAQKTTIPEHAGGFGSSNGIVSWHKFTALDDISTLSTTALTEGSAPESLDLAITEITSYLEQFGDWIKITDLAATASLDNVMQEAMSLLAESAGLKLSRVMRTALLSGTTTTVSPVAVANIANIDVITGNLIKKVARTLRTANAPAFPDGFYRGVIHPYQSYDLQGDSLWQDISKYDASIASQGGNSIIRGEVGRIHGVRFRESTEIFKGVNGGSSSSTYHAWVYGPDAYGCLDFKSQAVPSIDTATGKGMNIHLQPVNQPTKDDPLGQWGFVSWKASFATKVIDPNRIVGLKTGATQ